MLIVQPAIRFMNRLTYSRKMLIAALFFCVPIALLSYFLITNILEQIEFSSKERIGVEYATPLGKLLHGVLEERSTALLGAEAGGAPTSSDQLLAGVERTHAPRGDMLATKGQLQELKLKMGKLSGLRGGTAHQTFEAYNAVTTDLLGLIVLVADNSNLTLDPDIDSYYLMDTFSTKLPALAEALSRATIIASRLPGISAAPVGDRTDLIVLSGQIKTLVEGVNKNIRASCEKNMKLSERLQTPLQEIDYSVTEFLKSVAIVTAASTPAGLAKAAKNADAAVFRANEVVARELDGLLAARVSGFRTRMTTYLSISFVLFLIGVYLNIACYLSVRFGIVSAKDVTLKVAEGDLTVEVPVLSQDELGEMARVCNTMTGNLRHIVGTLSDVTGRVHDCAGKLSNSVEQQSGFSTQLSSSVVEISSTMEEFTSTASQIARHSQSVVERADKTLDDTKNGAAEVENLNFKVNDISQNIQTNLTEIVELGRKSKEINKVMEIINNIANQTKLIAFNAALEAASAGEAGKRFGVVAVEIRRLADSVVESTSEIEGKITEILDSVNRLVMSSEKSFQLIQEGQEYASHTVLMLIESVEGVEETADAARQISLSTQQQQIASSQVVLALKDIEQGMRFATDSVRNSNSVTDELLELSEQMKKLVRTFKVSKGDDALITAANVETC
ncbi:MAG: methyl-accepting chemotaxis protein [Desulfuromonadaceae bacterium]|nr:methyl-accepting chemotaxis protein [Desulfuromonadaceae bacterium]MDD5105720.1 methyl-accepting chemotaxis protein [Desulfuromonadaceae bacterium]